MNKDIRWIQRFDNYNKALTQLTDAINLTKQRDLTALESQGLIQSFEYTHELAWKTLKDFLEEKGNVTTIYGPKDATKEAFKVGLIKDGEIWMNMIKSRNLTSHTYNEDTASEITMDIVNNYYLQFLDFKKTFSEIAKKEIGEE